MEKNRQSNFWLGFLSGVFVIAVFVSGAVASRLTNIPLLDRYLPPQVATGGTELPELRVVDENEVVAVVEKVAKAVVTVALVQEQPVLEEYALDPFGMFRGTRPSGEYKTEQVDIGSGFVVDASGLVVTNKHVVARGDTSSYKIILQDNREYQVEKIWRDPSNDLAILKISGDTFPVVEIGDSDLLKVGNYVIAIGTALGEFRHTVTTGVVSGLGRGITAGDTWGSFAEHLDNVI